MLRCVLLALDDTISSLTGKGHTPVFAENIWCIVLIPKFLWSCVPTTEPKFLVCFVTCSIVLHIENMDIRPFS